MLRTKMMVLCVMALGASSACAERSSGSPAPAASTSAATVTSSVGQAAPASAAGSPTMSTPARSAVTSRTPSARPPASTSLTSGAATASSPPIGNSPTSAPSPVLPTRGGGSSVTGQLTLTGTVENGVEHGCLLLADEKTGRKVNLRGGDSSIIKDGAAVTVVGVLRPGAISFCQQGPIFQVLQAKAR